MSKNNYLDIKKEAKALFTAGMTLKEISAEIGVALRTLYDWKEKEGWKSELGDNPKLEMLERRFQFLVEKPDKNALELREMQIIPDLIEKVIILDEKRLYTQRKMREHKAAITQAVQGQNAPTVKSAGDGEKRRGSSKKNDFSHVTDAEVIEHFMEKLFAYQLELWETRHERTRIFLKSRQIGATFYFAREAFADALLNGKNKCFLSASRAQAGIFRAYIRGFAKAWFGVDLKGKDEISIVTPHTDPEAGTKFVFFSTNCSTSQGFNGDLYVDEFFWIPNFKQLSNLADGMSSHKKFTRTYFSTPSATSHEAYPFWSGEAWNENQIQRRKPTALFPGDRELRDGGRMCPDGVFRLIITLEDAEAKGCDLFNRTQLEDECSPEEFAQKYMCKFIDGQFCAFKLDEVLRCLEDESAWRDFNPSAARPYAGKVWMGYDPARFADGSAVVVIAQPTTENGDFRILELLDLCGMGWDYQVEKIKKLTEKYDVEYIGIDTTKQGTGVYDAIRRFFHRAEAIHYDVETKNELILRAQSLISAEKIKWDPKHKTVAQSFMLIQNALTGDRKATYKTRRTKSSGHGDAAWAVMHALKKRPLNVRKRSCKVY